MTNRIFRVEVEMRGQIEILALDENEAREQATRHEQRIAEYAAGRGMYFNDPKVTPRRVLGREETT